MLDEQKVFGNWKYGDIDREKNSGYNLARMKYTIILAPAAIKDLKYVRAYDRPIIKDKIKEHLSHQPTRTGKTSIKRLSGLAKPQYRLRVEDYRIFYDVAGDEVHVLAIIPKSQATEWLEREGKKQ